MKQSMLIVMMGLMVSLSQAVVVGPYPVDPSTMHLWNFDIVGNTSIHDMVRSNALDLTLTNGASLVDSTTGCGKALKTYDGIANPNGGTMGPYVSNGLNTVAISSLTGADGAFTFEAIIRPDMGPAGLLNHMEIICCENDGGATDRGFQFRIDIGGAMIRFQTLSGSTVAFDAPITYTAGQWYHTAVTYDGTPNVAGNLKLYWTPLSTGAAAATQVGGPFTMTADLDAADLTRFCIGNELRTTNGYGNENFEGLIDVVRISGVARAANAMMLRSSIPWVKNPVPASGQIGIDPATTKQLAWNTAEIANVTKHYLYLAATEPNFAGVSPVIVTDITDPIESNASLAPDKIYYWRVDESVNNSGPTDANSVTGPIWSFETIKTIPAITANPENKTVIASESASFNTGFNSYSTPTVSWYKAAETDILLASQTGAGTKIVGDYTVTVTDTGSGSFTSTLSIANIEAQDEGYYYCSVTNAGGSAKSNSGRLVIARLVAYYPMNTIEAGLTPDVVGGYNMTLSSDDAGTDVPTLAAGMDGLGGNSLLFNNSNSADPNNAWGQYAQIGAGVADYEDMTLSMWINWNGGNDWQRIIDFGNDTTQYMFLTAKTGTNLRFAIRNGDSGEQILNTSQLPTGQWVHVAVTLSGNTGRLYVNGKQQTINTDMTVNPIDFSPTLNYLGKSQFTADPYFNGRIDDFKVYNYALDDISIADMYLAGYPDATLCILEYASNLDLSGPEGTADCIVNLYDLAVFAQNWLSCGIYPDCE